MVLGWVAGVCRGIDVMQILHEEATCKKSWKNGVGFPDGKVRGTDSESFPLFEIRSLTFRYPDGHRALNGIDLELYEGERIALVGRNGAGKTTLVKHLNGLNVPSAGTVLYKGEVLNGSRLTAARLEIGMLFQDPDDQLFSNTVDEDVAFGPFNQGLTRSEVEMRVVEALEKVGLVHLRYRPPHYLSFGQKKRAALATLLSMDPRVLILDEPTANLDPKQERLFQELIGSFFGTLICISHDLPFLYSLCERAVVLEKGGIHHDFTMEELVSHRQYLRDHGLDFTFRLSCCRYNGKLHQGERHLHIVGLPQPVPRQKSQEDRSGIETVESLIQLKDYSYRYPDGTAGVRDVSLSIADGESVAILGENGAGKSTLVSCLAGILEGMGEYVFDGTAVFGKSRKNLWRSIGMVFQDPADQLFCPSCRDEVAFGLRQLRLPLSEVNGLVDEALALVRLSGFENRVPHHLSAGERKRLAIAAVLALRPRIMILDEPTSNLDPRSEELLCEILLHLDITKILISHDIDIISLLCRRTLVMHHGMVIRDYSTSDFLHDGQLVSINGIDYTFKNACRREILKLQGDA